MCTPRYTAPQQTPDVYQGTLRVHPDTPPPENTRRSSRYIMCTPRHATPQQTLDAHQGTACVHPDTRHPNKHQTFIRVRYVYTQTHNTPTFIIVQHVYTQIHDTPATTRRSSGYATCTPRNTTPQQTLDVHQGTPSAHTNTRHPSKHQPFIRIHHVYNQTHNTPTNTRRSSGYTRCT